MDVPSFGDSFQRELPADPIEDKRPRQVEAAVYSKVAPQQFPRASLLAYSHPLAERFGFSSAFCQSAEFVQAFSGSQLLPGMKPYAMCYGGHQFGHWAGQLGDGRAINLGEYADTQGLSHVFQLKGAGPTPYSRSADGFAVLRSSIREFLCSEAMFHLGVPTTRALALIASGEQVERDMFYNGNPQFEPGAIVTRVAPTFIRFGNFEIFSARKDIESLRRLFAFTIKHHYPHLHDLVQKDVPQAVIAFLSELSERSADMIVHWMRVGFVHGVMNTDNMSIIGQTIDYGPYGWLDNFDPQWTPNTTDAQQARYRYENQPAITQWNLLQLANALYPLVNSAPELEQTIRDFSSYYDRQWHAMMAQKLGLRELDTNDENDREFLISLERNLHATQMDMTLFYRRIDSLVNHGEPNLQALQELSYLETLSAEDLDSWGRCLQRYGEIMQAKGLPLELRQTVMNAVNPAFTLRNWVSQLAIEKSYDGDFSAVEHLLEAIRHPYTDHVSHRQYQCKRPDWALNKPGCSKLSCSS